MIAPAAAALLAALLAGAGPRETGNAACLSCHALPALAGRIRIDPAVFRRSVHGGTSCRACHTDVVAYPHGPVGAVDCAACHGGPRRWAGRFHDQDFLGATLLPREDGISFVAAAPAAAAPTTPDAACLPCHETATVAGSVHAGRRCVECHVDAAGEHLLARPGGPPPPPLAAAACGRCHVDEAAYVAATVHSLARARGDTEAAACASCHGTHDVLPPDDSAAPVHPTRVAATCLRCHGDPAWARARGITVRITPDSYAASVHARTTGDSPPGRPAATCVDCHGAHTIAGRSDPLSSIRHDRLAATCGRCHAAEAEAYAASAHGRSAARGSHEVPTCSDCHGEHAILPHADPRSPVSRRHVAQDLCLGCHDRAAIQEKFGLPARRGATYLDSYHGLATRGRSEAAAVCVDCHGAHRILGADDDSSTVHPSNLVRTCGRCHAGATAAFATSEPVHATYGDHRLTRLVRLFYRSLIVSTLGGMAVWVSLLTLPAIRRRWAAAAPAMGGPVRFRRSESIQHTVLLLSFATLVVTGFALAFPDAFWVSVLAEAGLDEDLRGLLHRAAGVALLATGAWHLLYVAGTGRGRWLLRRLVPRLADVRGALGHLLWAVGRRPHPPPLGHFSYFEKAEYWALVWGTIVMGATGLVLWFPEGIPRLWTTVAEAVHFYEALLAAGAILVWHGYFVLVDPDVFPLNPSIFRGRAPAGTELADRTEEGAARR